MVDALLAGLAEVAQVAVPLASQAPAEFILDYLRWPIGQERGLVHV